MREGGNVTSIQINGLRWVVKVARFLLYGANLFGAHMSTTQRHPTSAGAKFHAAVAESQSLRQPLQVVGAITAYAAKMAEQTGFKAVYLSGGGVAANSQLRADFMAACEASGVRGFLPSKAMCTDNAAMAAIAWELLAQGQVADLASRRKVPGHPEGMAEKIEALEDAVKKLGGEKIADPKAATGAKA